MNKIKIGVVLSICMIAMGCKKDAIQSFELHPGVYIYKDSKIKTKDSTLYSFAIKDESVLYDTVFVPLRITGEAAVSDRTVNYESINDSTTASQENYTLLPSVIKAGMYTGYLPVKVIKTPQLDTKEMKLWIRIIPSADFVTGPANQLSYLIRINNFLSKPSSWNEQYFGTYSQVKYGLIIRKSGYSEFTGLALNELRFIAQMCKNDLIDYEADNGHPMYDENGEPVIFP